MASFNFSFLALDTAKSRFGALRSPELAPNQPGIRTDTYTFCKFAK